MISCKEYTDLRKKELKEYIKEKGLHPTLVVIQVGDRPESNSYIRGKMRDCEEVGIKLDLQKIGEEVTTGGLEILIKLCNQREDVHGIILQLPVPDHIDVKAIQKSIYPPKDVDGFKNNSPFDPCTPKGVVDYLKYNNYEFEGKDALVIGRSDIVGKPLAGMLTDLDCTVTLAHSKTEDLQWYFTNTNIVFTCIDKIEWFDLDYMDNLDFSAPDIIDIGLGIGKDGKLHGNCSGVDWYKNKCPKSICISGTGGVGLLTRYSLLENVVKACEMQKGKKYEY